MTEPVRSAEESHYVPGHSVCPKCDFYLVSSVIHKKGISPDKSTPPNCPNDGTEMFSVSWKDHSKRQGEVLEKVVERVESERKRVEALETEVERYENTLRCIAEPERQDRYTPQQLAKHALRTESLDSKAKDGDAKESYYGKHCEEEEHLKVIEKLMRSDSDTEDELKKERKQVEDLKQQAVGLQDRGDLALKMVDELEADNKRLLKLYPKEARDFIERLTAVEKASVDTDKALAIPTYGELQVKLTANEAEVEQLKTGSNDLTTFFCSNCEAEAKESLRIQIYYNNRSEKQSEEIDKLQAEVERLNVKGGDVCNLAGVTLVEKHDLQSKLTALAGIVSELEEKLREANSKTEALESDFAKSVSKGWGEVQAKMQYKDLQKELRAVNKGAESNAHINRILTDDKLDLQQKLELAEEALKRLAFIPDEKGFTYGSTLHDVGKMSEFAKQTLEALRK